MNIHLFKYFDYLFYRLLLYFSLNLNIKKNTMNTLKKIYLFYYEGFSTLTKTSRRLWLIIAIKLFIMFAILKIFFFPNFLNTNFETDEKKSEYVFEQLPKPSNN